jgi:hypothetical protein
MNQDQPKQENLVNTTDCLEAVSVFKAWKNFLFVVALCCLLLLQGSFWLVKAKYVKGSDETPAVPAKDAGQMGPAAEQASAGPNQPAVEPNQPAAEPNQPAEAAAKTTSGKAKAHPRFGITTEHLTWLIRFTNFVLILAAILYCLTMLFSLKVSMLGRLGGINHICRAFFLSLAFVVLLFPWQKFFLFPEVVIGAIYTPGELLNSCAVQGRSVFGNILHYLRFTGLWALVLLLLVFSHVRSCHWAKAILRRLEVI